MNEIQESSWDYRKILVFVILVVLLIFGLKRFVLDKKIADRTQDISVKSTSVKNEDGQVLPEDNSQNKSSSVQKTFENKLETIKQEVNKINVVDVATSTPTIQKVINDIKNLQNLPQSLPKDACLKICQGL